MSLQKGEVVAYLESREVADAKSEFLTAGANLELQTTLIERERSLFEKKISAEQQFLRAENAFSLSKLRHDLARQNSRRWMTTRPRSRSFRNSRSQTCGAMRCARRYRAG